MRTRFAILLLFSIVAWGCRSARMSEESVDYDAQYASDSFWFESAFEVNSNYVDVFYLIATEVSESYKGRQEVYNAQLTNAERESMIGEMRFLESAWCDSINFFSPYYHQVTMHGFRKGGDVEQRAYEKARAEVFAAFDYYMEHQNGGRPFILAGFSQGAMLTLDLLKYMTDEQYSRLVGAYMLGYRLSREDLEHPHVRAAKDADEKGVAISFNSVAAGSLHDVQASLWPLVSQDAVTCINPVNWRTDTATACFRYSGHDCAVSVDTNLWVLKVAGVDPAELAMEGYAPMGNLHRGDLLLYIPYLLSNMKHRAYGTIQPPE